MLFHGWKRVYFVASSLKYVSNSQIDHLTTHVQVITRRQTGGQLLPKPLMIQFTAAYMHDQYSSIKHSIVAIVCCWSWSSINKLSFVHAFCQSLIEMMLFHHIEDGLEY